MSGYEPVTPAGLHYQINGALEALNRFFDERSDLDDADVEDEIGLIECLVIWLWIEGFKIVPLTAEDRAR